MDQNALSSLLGAGAISQSLTYLLAAVHVKIGRCMANEQPVAGSGGVSRDHATPVRYDITLPLDTRPWT